MEFKFVKAHVANNGVNIQTRGPATTHDIPDYYYATGESILEAFQLMLKFYEDDQPVTLFLNNDFQVMPAGYNLSDFSRDLTALSIKRFIRAERVVPGMFVAYNKIDGMLIYAGPDARVAEEKADSLFTD